MFEKVKNFVKEKKNAIMGSVAAATAVVASSPAVFAAEGTAPYTFTSETFAPITDMITANIPVLLTVVVGILAITIGIPWAIKFIRKFIK